MKGLYWGSRDTLGEAMTGGFWIQTKGLGSRESNGIQAVTLYDNFGRFFGIRGTLPEL